jgi:transcriptional regulator with XRE-family HTH domain
MSETVPTPRGPIQAALGKHFRALRKARHISLARLAQELGCSINYIRWYERGARALRADDLVRAAKVLGVDASEFLSIEEGMNRE